MHGLALGNPPRDAAQSLASEQRFSCEFYELFIVFSLPLHLSTLLTLEATTSDCKNALQLHLYEHFMNPLFEIYGFGYPMI